MTLYVAESDNMNIMDAMQLAKILVLEKTVSQIPENEVEWNIPDYWQTLFHNGPINKTIY